MEIQPLQDQNRPMQCAHCKNALDHTDFFCEHCGYPVKGTDEAKSAFHFQVSSSQLQLKDSGENIRKATNSLYVVAAVFVIYAGIFYFVNPRASSAMSILLTNLSLAFIFFILGWWSSRKPVAAIISGLSLYVAVQLVDVIVEPTSLFRGIILKIFVLYYLIRGLQSAVQAGRVSRELKEIR